MSSRVEYSLDMKLIVSLDDETLESAKEIIEARVNEMCAALERKDDVRIVLMHHCNVEQYD